MPAERLRPLYKGKCLDDLKPLFDINVDIDPKRLYKSAPKLFEAAEAARLKGDEEVSYIYYMKFLSAIQRVKQLKTNRKEIQESVEIKRHQVEEALDHAEKLSTSLRNRYEELKPKETEANKLASELNDIQIVEKSTHTPKKTQTVEKAIGYADVSDEFISCAMLYNLLVERKNLLVMDVRSASYFQDSHLKSTCVINVPDTIIEAGMTTARLEKVLPSHSKDAWTQRGAVDLIVLMDWSTALKNFKPESSIAVLREILLKWDLQYENKCKPLILEGGYEEWLLRYPVCTTNPSPDCIPMVQNLSSSDILSDIEYPNLSESLESSQPSIDRSSKPSLVYSFSPKSTTTESTVPKFVTLKPSKPLHSSTSITSKPVFPNKVSSSTSIDQRPSVDRKSKAAALVTYEERSRNVQALLRQEEAVVATTLQLEQDKQRKEEERERTRLRREMEAEEEMRLQLQEREEQLLRDIQHLEQMQQEKDRENQALRDELAEYKKKEQEEYIPKEHLVYKQQEEAIAERIRNSEEKRKKIVQDRERKIREEYQNQKKKLVRSEDSERSQGTLTYEEREKQAREVLHQQRLHKERQKQGKLDEKAKDRGHQDAESSKTNRSPLPNRSTVDLNRDHKKVAESANEQLHSFKNKVNGTYIAPLKDTPSGIMKRSRSSPNIAQLNDEELNARGKPYKSTFTPDIRASKRNFSPVYGDLGRGLTGLKNLGNTCYMNSIIQCLSNTTPLAKYFVSGQYRNDINRQTETRGEIAEEVAAVVRALWSSSYKCIATRDLRSVVGKHRDQFQTSQQQDSNEFLTILMDWLHEDLKKPPMKLICDRSEQQDWEKQWDEFYKENTSLIVLLFYGQQKSTVKCLQCYKESVRYETFSNLTLPLPSNTSSCTLEDCVQLYVKGERITGWKCPACKEPRDAMKKFDIIKLPPILIIHFKRFYIDGWCRKRQTFVQFPLTEWDMRKYTLLPEQKYTKYNLYGVSNHYGTMEGGHYTAYCKSIEHKKWYKFDDNEVSEISPGDVQTGAAYILFYASINFNVPDVS